MFIQFFYEKNFSIAFNTQLKPKVLSPKLISIGEHLDLFHF